MESAKLLFLLMEKDETNRSMIARQLQKVTGQELGEDLEDWKAWLDLEEKDN